MPKSLFFVAMQTPRMIATPEVLRAMLVLLEVCLILLWLAVTYLR